MDRIADIKRMISYTGNDNEIKFYEHKKGLWFLSVDDYVIMSSRLDDDRTLDIMVGWLSGYTYNCS